MPILTTLIALKLGAVAVAGLAVWGAVRTYLSEVLVPAIRDRISAKLAEALVTILQAVDNWASVVRRGAEHAFRAAYALFRSTLLRAESIYEMVSPMRVRQTTTVYTAEGEKVVATPLETEMDWNDVPGEVKAQWFESGTDKQAKVIISEELLQEIERKVPKDMLL